MKLEFRQILIYIFNSGQKLKQIGSQEIVIIYDLFR